MRIMFRKEIDLGILLGEFISWGDIGLGGHYPGGYWPGGY